MRRPLKPFVTEYKGTNRRPKDGVGLFGSEMDTTLGEGTDRKAPKTHEARAPGAPPTPQPRRGEAQRPVFGATKADDGYEAAMRAADALFSSPPSREAEAPHMTAAHDLFAKPDDATRMDSDSAPAGGTGRILRVLDEAPDPAVVELESERVPKRRGRKPGSKNKPKAPSFEPIQPPAFEVDVDDETTLEIASADDQPSRRVTRPIGPPMSIPLLAPRSVGRYAWVRTKLRPGESWKRRLPKVLW